MTVFLSLLIIFSDLFGQDKIAIIDYDSYEPIAFAVLYVGENKKELLKEANVNGFIDSEKITTSNIYCISRLGYKDINISGEELLKSSVIKMEMLPFEISPITVKPEKAFKTLETAIQETYNLIPKKMLYLETYHKDRVIKNNEILAVTNAITVTAIEEINKKDNGAKTSTKLVDISHTSSEHFNVQNFKSYKYYQNILINNFYLNKNNYFIKNSIFYILDTNDSVVIVGFKPKKTYSPNKKSVLISGRYIIDKETFRILKIETELPQHLIEFQNKISLTDQKKEILIENFHREIFFSEIGLPAYFIEKLNYKFKTDTKKKLWTNKTEKKSIVITEKNYISSKGRSITMKKPMFYETPLSRNSNFDTAFDKKYNNINLQQ